MSGLLKESFQRPPPGAVIGVLASLNAQNAKADASSSSAGTGESSSASRSSSRYTQATAEHDGLFRLDEKGGRFGRTHGQLAFDEFLARPVDREHEAEFARDGPASSRDTHSEFSGGTSEGNLPRAQERATWGVQNGSRYLACRNEDGAAVVALLSHPAPAVGEEPSNALDPERDGGEERRFERLQTGKRPAEPIDASHASNPLDLMPDFGAPWGPSHASLASQQSSQERGHLLTSMCGEAQPWIDILNRYHDEVWGDTLPLIQDAREELKAANEHQTRLQDGPAIRRLKMVLQHLTSLDDP